MRKSLAHLPKHKRDELKLIVEKIRTSIQPEMIILYGSYARGDYKEQKGLATHTNTLESAGLIEVKKEFRGKIPHTSYRITKTGRREFQEYWENMSQLAPE